ncbi:MAG: putative lipid II flippase FtsW [Blastocatellia bacterium]|jgi:cell division protein FtsW
MAGKKRISVRESVESLRWDIWIAVTAVGLVLFGVNMVYSASAGFKSPERFLTTQLVAALIGLIAMIVLRQVDYHRYANPFFVYGTLLICVVLLGMVFLFKEVNGAHRWINLAGLSIQPSEFTKVALIIFLGWFLAHREKEGVIEQFWPTIAPGLLIVGLLIVLILKEPDLGTAGVLLVIFTTMMIVAGASLRSLLKFTPAIIGLVAVEIYRKPYRMARMGSFLNPDDDPLGKGYHILQALIGIGSGGINGLGFGKGRQKMAFLPEPNSDFIFPVIAEELGLIGATTMILAFGFFLWRGLRASRRAPDTLGRLLAVGITVWITTQAFTNISVALKLLPTKGITLPFISAGGSSLIAALIAVGILLNVSEQGVVEGETRPDQVGQTV